MVGKFFYNEYILVLFKIRLLIYCGYVFINNLVIMDLIECLIIMYGLLILFFIVCVILKVLLIICFILL